MPESITVQLHVVYHAIPGNFHGEKCGEFLELSFVLFRHGMQKCTINYPRPRGRRVQYLVGLCVCVYVCLSVCLLPQNCCLSSIISKSEHATALNLCKELAILLFYKTG